MNEKNNSFMRKIIGDYIDEETGEYVKSTAIEDGRYKFYLRFVSKHFCPCDECQEKLHTLITKADNLYLGNKNYEPAIELRRYWELIDASWVEIERRPATKADYKRCYPKHWKEIWEKVQKDAN